MACFQYLSLLEHRLSRYLSFCFAILCSQTQPDLFPTDAFGKVAESRVDQDRTSACTMTNNLPSTTSTSSADQKKVLGIRVREGGRDISLDAVEWGGNKKDQDMFIWSVAFPEITS